MLLSDLPLRLRVEFAIVDAPGFEHPHWVWCKATVGGYGVVNWKSFGGREAHFVHRLVYTLLVGPIPEDLTIDHLCLVKPCAYPGHLEVVTAGVNVLRGDTITGRNSRKTHCIHGHEFTPENTRVLKRGERVCITCDRERYKKWRERN